MPFELDVREPKRFFYGTDEQEWIDLILLDEDGLQEIRDKLKIKTGFEWRTNKEKEGRPLEAVPILMTPDQISEVAKEANFESITDWHIIDGAGNEIPRTIENVDLMMRKCRPFRNFVEKSRRALKADQEAEIKNS